jgi:hypothetical protein
MAIAMKPKNNAKMINKNIEKGGVITPKNDANKITHVSLKLSGSLNKTIQNLLKNKFGIKRTKKQWIMESIFSKIKLETGKEYTE